MDVLNDIRKVLPKEDFELLYSKNLLQSQSSQSQSSQSQSSQSQSDEPQIDPTKKLLFQDVLFVKKKESRNQQNDFAKIAKNLFALSSQLHQRHLFVKIVKFKLIVEL